MDAEIQSYLDHLVLDRERAPNTIDRYRALLGRFVVFARYELRRPAVAAREVDRDLVERFVRHGRVEVGAHAAASTRNVRLTVLKGFFGHQQITDRLDRNPTIGTRSAKVKANSPTRSRLGHRDRVRASVHCGDGKRRSPLRRARCPLLVVMFKWASPKVSRLAIVEDAGVPFVCRQLQRRHRLQRFDANMPPRNGVA